MPPDPVPPETPFSFLGLGSEENLRTLADQLPDGLFTIDTEGAVTFWNRAAERITGWTRAEAVGRHCSILAGDAVDGCSCGAGPFRCGLVERGRTSKRCTIRTRDDRLLLIVKNAVPLVAPDGRTVGALESFTEAGPAPELVPLAAGRPPAPADPRDDFFGMVGRHPAMLELERTIELVARSGSTVMVLGESGTGKGLVAEAIHGLSPRAAGPFVRVSCSALDEGLLEGELFGVGSASPGAPRERSGRFLEANGGTLLLDEVGDIPLAIQPKLLRVIEERQIERAGDPRPLPVDVRLVCTTHRDLKRLVEEGRFRADLYFRLNVFPLHVPPLREHAEDVPLVVERLLARLPRPAGARTRLAPDVLRLLAGYPWPGNVRELGNVLEYAGLRAGAGEIRPEHLPADVRIWRAGGAPAAVAREPAGEEDERRRLVEVLERFQWNRTRAARALGVSRVTLWKRLKRHGLHGRDVP